MGWEPTDKVSLGVTKTSEVGKSIQNIIENMRASIEEQLSTMTEIEETTESLSEMANKLSQITSGFKV